MREAKSFTISTDILAEIAASKGRGSTSDRVNELLRRALELERRERLEQEASEFFSTSDGESAERSAYQRAARKTISRD